MVGLFCPRIVFVLEPEHRSRTRCTWCRWCPHHAQRAHPWSHAGNGRRGGPDACCGTVGTRFAAIPLHPWVGLCVTLAPRFLLGARVLSGRWSVGTSGPRGLNGAPRHCVPLNGPGKLGRGVEVVPQVIRPDPVVPPPAHCGHGGTPHHSRPDTIVQRNTRRVRVARSAGSAGAKFGDEGGLGILRRHGAAPVEVVLHHILLVV
mmetsp:Transcript_25421/g.66532  ORF Transcript_25421/g.66532 Transcript_25421/m.66532 type:complete len:204 (-) Transcript_25421:1146-1757(-)